MAAALEDWRTAPIPERLRAALAFLEALTLRPAEITPASMRALQAAGVNDTAIREAAHVAFVFNTLNRLADSLGFTLPTDDEARSIGRALLRFGYGMAKLPG